jgi:hypothetical protein
MNNNLFQNRALQAFLLNRQSKQVITLTKKDREFMQNTSAI